MDNKNNLVALGAILAILAALGFLWFAEFRGGPRVDRAPLETLGRMVADETAKLLNQQGRVAIVSEIIEVARNPNLEAQVKGFKAGLAAHPGVTLKEARDVKRPPSDTPGVWPPNVAGQLVAAGAGADAVVLLVNLPPQLTAADVAALKGARGKLVVVGTAAPGLKPLLQQGFIHLSIVPRQPPAPAPAGKETPRQWFERVYVVATPTALAGLP
jgi:hypothetical protein